MSASDLFINKNTNPSKRPLADRLRPKSLSEVLGQGHILNEGGIIWSMVESGSLSSIILWGPAGSGKTSIARLLANIGNYYFVQLSAVFTGTADLKKIVEEAEVSLERGQQLVLFVDEIHRFNKTQQDIFLPYVENGTIILIGATTENPSFALNSALLSRAEVLEVKHLEKADLEELLKRAEKELEKSLNISAEAKEIMLDMAGGDGRYFLSILERLFLADIKGEITKDTLLKLAQRRVAIYDKANDGHYNIISALHKSVRGSDVNAGLYWFYRMVEAGEDLNFIARRLVRMAVEDIGLADPTAITQAISGWQGYERLGNPEGVLCLAQVVAYLSLAPKSNRLYLAEHELRELAVQTGHVSPPKNILNAPTKTMQNLGYGEGYKYDHDYPNAYSGQELMPSGLKDKVFYRPTEYGYEKSLKERIALLKKLKKEQV